MLLRFTIASVKRTKREYEYSDFSLSGGFSKTKKGIEYIVELTAEDGDRYFLYHERKADPTLRQYRIMYVDARKMVSGGGTTYAPEQEGAYTVRRYYTKEQFQTAVVELRENIGKRQKADAAELERIAAYV